MLRKWKEELLKAKKAGLDLSYKGSLFVIFCLCAWPDWWLKDVITSTWILDIIIKIVFSRKSPSFGIQQRRNWDDGTANPNDEKENPCACFGHPRFQGSNNGNVPVNEKCSFIKLILHLSISEVNQSGKLKCLVLQNAFVSMKPTLKKDFIKRISLLMTMKLEWSQENTVR